MTQAVPLQSEPLTLRELSSDWIRMDLADFSLCFVNEARGQGTQASEPVGIPLAWSWPPGKHVSEVRAVSWCVGACSGVPDALAGAQGLRSSAAPQGCFQL